MKPPRDYSDNPEPWGDLYERSEREARHERRFYTLLFLMALTGLAALAWAMAGGE